VVFAFHQPPLRSPKLARENRTPYDVDCTSLKVAISYSCCEWSNPTLRTSQHSTIQRPQGQVTGHGQAGPGSNTPHQHLQNQTHEDGSSSGQGQFSGGGDDYRFGGSGGVGQLSGSSQPQTSNIDDFPPLGGVAGEIGPDRRSLIQNAAAYNGSSSANAFPGLGQTRNGLSSPTDGQDRPLTNTVGGRGIHPGSGRSFPPVHFGDSAKKSSIPHSLRRYASEQRRTTGR
jgi:hypothetical protein